MVMYVIHIITSYVLLMSMEVFGSCICIIILTELPYLIAS
jgi:hypothetical protein